MNTGLLKPMELLLIIFSAKNVIEVDDFMQKNYKHENVSGN